MSMNIDALKKRAIEANKAYRSGEAIITDAEYDSLLEQCKAGMQPASYSSLLDSLHEVKGKVKHPQGMGSLNTLKAEEPDSVKAFIAKHVNGQMSVSAKVDGISCRLCYVDGKLASATSRGDGTFGEDLTSKIWHVKSVPASIKSSDHEVNVRGELVILKSDFSKIESSYSNARNACAGIMNQKDFIASDVANVSFIPYTILGSKFTKHEQFSLLDGWGFKTAWHEEMSHAEAAG